MKTIHCSSKNSVNSSKNSDRCHFNGKIFILLGSNFDHMMTFVSWLSVLHFSFSRSSGSRQEKIKSLGKDVWKRSFTHFPVPGVSIFIPFNHFNYFNGFVNCGSLFCLQNLYGFFTNVVFPSLWMRWIG